MAPSGHRIACWRFTMVFLVATIALSESHRPATDKETKRFGLPEDAIVIVDWDSAGVKEAPPKEVADFMCEALKSARKCMNVSKYEPIYYGRNCTGAECYMYPHPGPASCLVNITNMDIDMQNATRAVTCGLDPEDDAIIRPVIPDLGPPSSKARKHIDGLPKGISVNVWNLCLKGEYHDVLRIVFDEVPSYWYECKVDPFCARGGIRGGGLCYSTPEHLKEHRNAGRHTHERWWWFYVLLVGSMFGMVYMQ